jgi:hypothetical protein
VLEAAWLSLKYILPILPVSLRANLRYCVVAIFASSSVYAPHEQSF